MNVFDPDGAEVFTFETPEIFLFPGDVSVFSDGTIAVCDQSSNWIETYRVDVENQTSQYLGPIATPAGNTFVGSFVDTEDNLWATNFRDGKVLKLSRTGEILDEMALQQGSNPVDLVIEPADGSLWITVDWDDPTQPEEVLHLGPEGQFMGGFVASVPGNIDGIARTLTGDLWVSGEDMEEIRAYTDTGVPLTPIPIVDPQVPVFLMAVPEPPPLVGDWDGDGDVDIADFTVFRQCARGPGASTSNPCKAAFDFDSDADVDHHDWWVFQQAFTGEIGSQAGSDEATEPRSDEGTGGRSDEGTQPRRGIKRKPATLIPPAYPEVILEAEVDPNSPEVVIRKK